MERGPSGEYQVTVVGGERVQAFVPSRLPPQPALDLTGDRQLLLERALLALGRLDSITLLLPDPGLFLYAYVRREAVLSSQIEGTQSSLSDLLLFELPEAPGAPLHEDVVEVSNYVRALEHGMGRLKNGSWCTEAARRIPPLSELDRRDAARQRALRAALARNRRTLHGRP